MGTWQPMGEGLHVLQDNTFEPYLQLEPIANDGVWAVAEDGTRQAEHTYWHGFANRTAKGLRLEFLGAAE